MVKKQVTNEELARMIANGFSNLEARLGGVESRLTGIEGQMLKIHDRMGAVETKLDKALYQEIVRLEARLKKVEEKVGIA